MLELTNRCNLDCTHCVRESPSLHHTDELTTEEWLRVLDELADINTFTVCFTGGEATLHPDLLLLIRYARKLNMRVALKTNGLNLSRLASPLKADGVGLIDVSLYGSTAATHERCTLVPGSFARTTAGIRAARAEGIAVMINISLFRWNADELHAIRQFAAETGCSVNREYIMTTTDLGRTPGDICTPSQIRAIEQSWPMMTIPSHQNGSTKVRFCTQGINRMAITARGEILSCITIREPMGHVRGEGVAAVWRRSTENGRPHNLDYDRFSRCLKCDFLPKCHVCPGHNQAATGEFYEPPLERCYAMMSLHGFPTA